MERATITIWAAPGRNVRHPHTKVQLPETGLTVFADDPYWYRRIEEGDVVTAAPARTASVKPAAAPAAPAAASLPAAAASLKE